MNDLSQILDKLRERTEKLIHLHRSAEEEIARLKASNNELKNRVAELESKAEASIEKSVFLDEKESIKGKIDLLVREIDNCLEKLNT